MYHSWGTAGARLGNKTIDDQENSEIPKASDCSPSCNRFPKVSRFQIAQQVNKRHPTKFNWNESYTFNGGKANFCVEALLCGHSRKRHWPVWFDLQHGLCCQYLSSHYSLVTWTPPCSWNHNYSWYCLLSFSSESWPLHVLSTPLQGLVSRCHHTLLKPLLWLRNNTGNDKAKWEVIQVRYKKRVLNAFLWRWMC